MTSFHARNAYRQGEQLANIHPVKLIHLMYERVLAHLDLAIVGINQNDALKRGENLGKSIALITELNASIKKEDNTEAAQFLRGLYTAILMELPKVSISNDVKIVQQSRGYVKRLMELWEQTAMREHGINPDADREERIEKIPQPEPVAAPNADISLLNKGSDNKTAPAGLSVSI